MRHAEPVSLASFLAYVNMEPLLDEGETAEEYLLAALRNDPTAGVYRSWWGDARAWFLQTAGFEFVFAGPQRSV